MADNTLKTRLLSAYNTLDFWSTCTTIPLGGEVCYAVDDDNKILEMKIGDGIHKYSELPAQSFDSADHLYKLSTPVSTTADASNFTATTYLQSDDGQGGTFGNSSSAVLTIPAATTTKAGVETATDKKIIDAAADTRLTGGTTGSTAAGNAYVTVNTKTVSSAGATSAGTSNLKVNGLGSMAFKSSADFVSNISTAAYNTSGVTLNQTKNGSAASVANFGAAVKSNITTAISLSSAPSSSSTDLPTDYAVWKAIDDLPEPMIFKGSVGTASATTSSLPTPAKSNEGWTYKAITTGTSAVYHDLDGGETAANVKVGDTLISNGSKWIRVPSGDEPSGTVTSVGIDTNTTGAIAVSGGPITSSGTLIVNHKDSGVTAGVYGAAQTASFGGNVAIPSVKVDAKGHVTTAGTVNVKMPTVTTSDLPNSGVTAGTYGSATQVAKITVNTKGQVTSAENVTITDKHTYLTSANFTSSVNTTNHSVDLKIVTSGSSAAIATASVPAFTTNTDGIVKPPGTTASTKFLRSDNTWQTVVTSDKHTYLATNALSNTPATGSVKIGIQSSGTSSALTETTIPAATTTLAGVMTTADKSKLDELKQATAGSGLSNSDSNGIRTINHASTITAGNVGPSANSTVSLAWGKTSAVSVPYISYNNTGHTTAASTKSISFTMPSNPNTDTHVTTAYMYGNNDNELQLDIINGGTNPSTVTAILEQTLILNGNFTV